jgi:hypothetical protein
MNRAVALGLMLTVVGVAGGAPSARAYDFTICSHLGGIYVHVRTVSSFCHDRTPVERSDPPLDNGSRQCVSGSTALGCLIDKVDIVTSIYPGGPETTYSWDSPIGRAGGRWVLFRQPYQDPFVCYDGERDDCL